MRGTPWDVEPIFGQKYDDFKVSVVLYTVVHQPGRHLCRTAVRHQLFITDCQLQQGHDCHTILDGRLVQNHGQWWIQNDENTSVFPRPSVEMLGMYRLLDLCCGVGAVAKGFEACGATVACHVDSNAKFIEWKRERTSTPCILGNVAEPHFRFVMHARVALWKLQYFLFASRKLSRAKLRRQSGVPAIENKTRSPLTRGSAAVYGFKTATFCAK